MERSESRVQEADVFDGIDAVLVDVDGTVLDSNDAHAKSWVTAFSETGFRVRYDDVRALIGKGGDKLLAETVGLDEESPIARRVAIKRQAIFANTYLGTLAPTAGIRELLVHLRDRNIRIVVASSADRDGIDALLRQAGVDDLVDAIVTSDDAAETKPDPDIVEAALKKANVAPLQAVMIGDTPHDVDAASRAGVRTIALRCGGWWNDEALSGACAIFDDPAALLRASIARRDAAPMRPMVPAAGIEPAT